MKKIFLLLLFLLCSLKADAALVWKAKQATGQAKLGQKIVKLTFEAVNSSASKVTINSAKVTCDCMIVTGEFPKVLEPGKKLLINAEYDTTGKLGLNRGRILIDVAGKTETLLVEVDIPTAVTVSPRFLIWGKGDRQQKKVNIKVHKDWQGTIESASAKDGAILPTLKKTEDGYSVSIVPAADTAKKRTWVIVNSKDAAGKPSEYRIYLIFN